MDTTTTDCAPWGHYYGLDNVCEECGVHAKCSINGCQADACSQGEVDEFVCLNHYMAATAKPVPAANVAVNHGTGFDTDEWVALTR